MNLLKAYVQHEGDPEVSELGYVDLEGARELVEKLPLSSPLEEIPELVGFERGEGFIEFTRLSADAYLVRMEDRGKEKHLIGELDSKKALECLEDFFMGEELRWEGEMESY